MMKIFCLVLCLFNDSFPWNLGTEQLEAHVFMLLACGRAAAWHGALAEVGRVFGMRFGRG